MKRKGKLTVLWQHGGTHLNKAGSILLFSVVVSLLAPERAASLSLGERELDDLFEASHQVLNARVIEVHGECDESACFSSYGLVVSNKLKPQKSFMFERALTACSINSLLLGETYVLFIEKATTNVRGEISCDVTVLYDGAFLMHGHRAYRVSADLAIPFRSGADRVIIGYAVLYENFLNTLHIIANKYGKED